MLDFFFDKRGRAKESIGGLGFGRGVVGCVGAGVGGSWVFGQSSDMRTVVALESILLAFSSAATVGIFFGFYPANKAAQLDPIEALRRE